MFDFSGSLQSSAGAAALWRATLGKTIQRGIARGGCANETGMGQRATVMPRPSASAGVFEVVVDTLIVRSISAFGGARHRRPEGSRQLERGHSSGLFGRFRRHRKQDCPLMVPLDASIFFHNAGVFPDFTPGSVVFVNRPGIHG